MATMTGCWLLRKTDADASSSKAAKKKELPPKKEQNWLYVSVEITQALYDQNASVGQCDIHLPSGWHLNARRASFRCVTADGRGGTRSDTGGLSFCRIYAWTLPSPWTHNGGIVPLASPA
jgi:hypothetical protein